MDLTRYPRERIERLVAQVGIVAIAVGCGAVVASALTPMTSGPCGDPTGDLQTLVLCFERRPDPLVIGAAGATAGGLAWAAIVRPGRRHGSTGG